MATLFDRPISRFTKDTPLEVVGYLDDLSRQKWNKAEVEDRYHVVYRIKKADLLSWLASEDTIGIVVNYKFNATGSKWEDKFSFTNNVLMVTRKQL